MKFRKSLAKFTAVLLAFCLIGQGSIAQAEVLYESLQGQSAEIVDPDPEKWAAAESDADGTEGIVASPSEYSATGFIDIDYEPGKTRGGRKGLLLGAAQSTALPEKYSSLDLGYVSPVRDQNPYNTCWAFTFAGNAESSLMRSGAADNVVLSPLGVCYFFYHQPADPLGLVGAGSGNQIESGSYSYLSLGGNPLYAAMYYSSNTALFSEAQLPYSEAKASGSYTYSSYTPQAVQKAAYFYNAGDTEAIKKAVMEYGSVTVGIYSYTIKDSTTAHKKSYTNEAGETVKDYFAYNPASPGSDHAVQIIGWDDTLSKDLFTVSGSSKKPAVAGGWLVKNSWGDDWPASDVEHEGCFWLSYKNKLTSVTAIETVPADTYLHNYHYDGNGSNSTVNAPYAATVFRAQAAESITAVSVGLASTDTEYTVKIYKKTSEMSSPADGTLVHTQTGSSTAEGLYLMELNREVPLAVGDWFSIVVSIDSTADTVKSFFAEKQQSFSGTGYKLTFNADFGEKQGYISQNGSSWQDAAPASALKSSKCCPRIKALTEARSQTYTVTWLDEDGTVLDQETGVVRGTMPSFKKTIPQKGNREFAGWDSELHIVTGDQVYRATYKVPSYTISVSSSNTSYGTVDLNKIENISKGTQLTIQGNEARIGSTTVTAAPAASTAAETFEFVAWTVDGIQVASGHTVSVVKDISLQAVFRQVGKTYTVTVTSKNTNYGTVSRSELTGIPGGTVISADGAKLLVGTEEVRATPTDSTSLYQFSFESWTCGTVTLSTAQTVTVTENVTVTASFTRTYIGGGGGGGGGGGDGGSAGGGGSSGGSSAGLSSGNLAPTFSSFWYQAADGSWRIRNRQGQDIVSAWLCDDAVSTNGKEVWYLMNTDGTMLAAGLVQDNTGNFYSLETTHNGYYGMLRYKNGTYDCSGQQVYLEFSQNHDGTFGKVTNADGLAKLQAIYGVTKFGIDNSSCAYTSTF